MSEAEVIQGAGVVLWRVTKKETEIALVHRPKYDDWSLPKGKVEPGETHLACAAREAMEETGFEPVLGPEIGIAKYLAEGTPKEVRYWSARATGKSNGPRDSHEVDRVIWLSVSDAKRKVSVDDDREIIKFFESFGINTTPMSKKLEGMCVKTMVRTRPIRLAILTEITEENAASTPHIKKTAPNVLTAGSNLLKAHNAKIAFVVNPVPSESMLNRMESL